MTRRKHRKRISKDIPAKGRLQSMADQLWSMAVRDDWAHQCAVCKAAKVEAHHLIPRQHPATRYDLWNGIALCSRHHQFDPDVAPHQNAAGWMAWLRENCDTQYEWLVEQIESGAYRRFSSTTNHLWYMDTLMRLRQYVEQKDFERICGVKFTRYLLRGV